MMPQPVKRLALILAAMMCGCASYPQTMTGDCPNRVPPVPVNPQRVDFPVVSFIPPRGGNWCVMMHDEDRGAAFGKNQHAGVTYPSEPPLSITRHTLMASLFIYPPGLVDWIKTPADLERFLKLSIQGQSTSTSHLQRLQIERDPTYHDAVCFRHRYVRTGPGSGMGSLDFTEEVSGLVCQQPNRPRIVGISGSERYLTSDPPATKLADQFRTELDDFIGSVRFRP